MIPGIIAWRRAAGPWSPGSLSPGVWMDHNSTLTLDAGLVSSWQDQSPNGWAFGQLTADRRPMPVAAQLGGKRVVRFGGSAVLSGPNGSRVLFQNVGSAWMFVVLRKTQSDASPTSRRVFYSAASNGNARVAMYSDDATSGSANRLTMGGRRMDAGAYQSIKTSASIYDKWVMALGVTDYSARTISLYLDGVIDASMSGAFDAAGNTENTLANNFTLGGAAGSTFFVGDIAAALAGVAVLSAGDRDKLFGYYAWAYGLQGNLPVSHPYKTSPP